MSEKVILILCDGMTPASIKRVNHPFYNKLIKESAYSLNTKTVYPPVTLPCHISLFHSVTPERHGTTYNRFSPMVRPIDGLFEQLYKADKESAMFYSWDELRDCSTPGCIKTSACFLGEFYSCKIADQLAYDMTLKELTKADGEKPDFIFLYLQDPDAMGHNHGWETKEYDEAVYNCFDIIEKISELVKDEYSIIVTADHGGHDRDHGKDVPEDMTIPLFIKSKQFKPGEITKPTNIIDIAPTIANMMEIKPCKDWEGKII